MAKKRQVNFELTEEEYEKFEREISKTGLNRIDFFRRRVLNQDYLIKNIDDQFENIKGELDSYIAWHVDNNIQEMKKELGDFLEKKILVTMADVLMQMEKQVYRAVEKANGWE